MGKQKLRKVIDKIMLVWTSFILLSFILYISGLKYDYENLLIFLNVLPGIIYLTIIKFKYKEKIIDNKLDLAISLFFISMLIPIFLNSYKSLTMSVKYVLKYCNFLLLYFNIKLLSKNEKNISILLYVFLIILSVDVLYGIDIETFNLIGNKFEIKNYYREADTKIYSFNYVYHNVLSIIMISGVFVVQYILSKKSSKYDSLLYIELELCCIGFCLAFSRTDILIFGFIELIVLILKIKKKICIKPEIQVILSIITSIIFARILKYSYMPKIAIWVMLVLIILISVLINCIVYKLNLKKLKFNFFNKKIILIFCISLILLLILIFSITEPLTINKDNFSEIEKRIYTLKGLKSGQTYRLKFDYEDKDQVDTGYGVAIYGVLSNGQYETYEIYQLFNKNKDKDFELYCDEKYVAYKMQFLFLTENMGRFDINKMYIDGKEYKFNYKFIPYSVQYVFESINLKNQSLNERINVYKDSINLYLNNNLLGIGGDTWKFLIEENKSYKYTTIDIHSRPIEVLVSFGIFGIISYIYLIFVFASGIKNLKNDFKLIIFMLIFGIIIHSFVDLIMRDFSILTVLFFFLGIISNKFENIKVFKCYNNLVFVIIFIISIYITYSFLVSKYIFLMNRKKEDIKDFKFYCDCGVYNFNEAEEKIRILIYILSNYEDIDKDYYTKTIYKEYHKMLKYEKVVSLHGNLKMYLEIANDNGYEVDYKIVERSIKNFEPLSVFTINYMYHYIDNLNHIYEYMCNIFGDSSEISIIAKNKMLSAYELIKIKGVENLIYANGDDISINQIDSNYDDLWKIKKIVKNLVKE